MASAPARRPRLSSSEVDSHDSDGDRGGSNNGRGGVRGVSPLLLNAESAHNKTLAVNILVHNIAEYITCYIVELYMFLYFYIAC